MKALLIEMTKKGTTFQSDGDAGQMFFFRRYLSMRNLWKRQVNFPLDSAFGEADKMCHVFPHFSAKPICFLIRVRSIKNVVFYLLFAVFLKVAHITVQAMVHTRHTWNTWGRCLSTLIRRYLASMKMLISLKIRKKPVRCDHWVCNAINSPAFLEWFGALECR